MNHLDLTYILENVTSDKAFIAQLLNVFLNSLDQDIPPLEAAIIAGDHDQIRKCAHKVKSGFRSLGMTAMTQYLQELENMGSEGDDLKKIRGKFDGFTLQLPEVKAEIKSYQSANDLW